MNWVAVHIQHFTIAPILLPLLTAAILVGVREQNRKIRSGINIAACLLNLIIVALLINYLKEQKASAAFSVYLTANWDVPFSISLLVDRFSALMLLIAAVVALAAAIFATARWDRAGIHFHTLFQVQLMGINGAFITADLFNLFVFFEVLLAASYGLALHGSGAKRVRAGLHYITINLVASFFFLIGIALIYNTTGSLNLADIALYIRHLTTPDSGMLYIGITILAIVFLIKAAMWPLNFWLVPAYSASSPPSAAMFALLTKVGLYVILRLSTLFFSSTEVDSESWFGNIWLLYFGLLTLLFGALGMLSVIKPSKIAAYATLVSSGTIMTIIGFGQSSLTTAALYYLPASTLAIATFFLIAELIERPDEDYKRLPQPQETDEDRLVLRSYIQSQKTKKEERAREARLKAELLQRQREREEKREIERLTAAGEPLPPHLQKQAEITVNLDEWEEEIVGRPLPAGLAFLGVSFVCCALLISGLPPLASFIAKFGILDALLNPFGPASSSIALISTIRWITVALIILSGFFALLSFTRVGVRYFWSPIAAPAPKLRIAEGAAIILLLATCILLTTRAETSLRYTRAASVALYTPSYYINVMMNAQPVKAPNNEKRLQETDALSDGSEVQP